MTRQVSIQELLRAVLKLPPTSFESEFLFKSGYDTHQDHWKAWLEQYNSPGYYGRSDTTISDARTVYVRLNCGPMIIWLNEAAGESGSVIQAAARDMRLNGKGRAQTEAKIVRSHLPWERASLLLFR
ncbi:hypothetical protein HU675_0038645 [Bradyrhizobium septentrionale]|uniref:hypothetical protein n=1 Tax=Bradyrhizobium septentrionale TaxID=1404411 RepID=UPI0015971643|nr:hypothetical protein [Bradyrhizobium septentrionale]UGY23806.1 hypothetical protein HU675_0038645 [Bradyrhizobium septentrionale]